MIAIVDYQMGNLRSVQKAFEHMGFEAVITDAPEVMMDAAGLVLPGVGAFGDCYRELNSRGLVSPLLEWVGSGRPFLGICLGLQILFRSSEESSGTPGLKVIPGAVKRFTNGSLKVPHMGWNQVRHPKGSGGDHALAECPLFEGIPDGAYFYFVHSYYVVPEEPDVTCCVTDYGVTFTSAIWRDNVYAVQFHPEKSQDAGLRVIENFGRLALRGSRHVGTGARGK
ncbi:MAG: imidazole glycerol phosphate synthase subunit HisH [Candidatus Abyssobacteria bacterium SURF_17]|uniref:Imidazole glycerol phosphate synthase subunit HisH n=1 Tax=Candidatus Abyssobacteria bacterium SURF_17 TaxID=2093361 RepID=A0A419EZE6_9BACT|nr:MAG: imidazole glycerol phosphate synthase subunit HisH [Candidatus Abyssubacteria bacterium SURF_17]